MGGVFINYRTGDGDWAATFIARELSARFSSENIFFASKSIKVGEDFATRILSRLRQCDVFLAVIGERWLTMTDRQGGRRLDNPEDWVRREIIEAASCGLRVVPVFLDSTAALRESDLPEDIGFLARCQYLRLHHRNDDRDIARLLDEIGNILPNPAASPDDVAGQLRQAIADPGVVQDIVHNALMGTLEALSRHPVESPDLTDEEIAAKLEQRLVLYEEDMAQLLRLVAIGVVSGDDQHNELWIRVLSLVLNRDGRRSSPFAEPWASAEAYPALLLAYAISIAAAACDRDELVYRALTDVKAKGMPVLRALALRHVIDPQYAAIFQEGRYHALSRHLRKVLRPAFDNLLDDHEYAAAFEEYEYVRSLLELHDSAFSSLGEFAFQLAQGNSTVGKRMAKRMTEDSALLRSGAFEGAVANVARARQQLDASITGRYR